MSELSYFNPSNMSDNNDTVGNCMPYGNNTGSILYNFSYITFYHYNFCVTMVNIEVYSTFALTIPMMIHLLLLILITLFGGIKEDYKWFVFHKAILNFISACFIGALILFPEVMNDLGFISVLIILHSTLLAIVSIFLLAFTRFFYLYFSHLYHRIFNKKTLAPIILLLANT